MAIETIIIATIASVLALVAGFITRIHLKKISIFGCLSARCGSTPNTPTHNNDTTFV